MEQSPLSAVLFDLDGTLIDSIDLILRSYEHTLTTFKKGPFNRELILGDLGIPLWTHLGLFSDNAQEIEEMVVAYRAWNHDHHDELVKPYAGIDVALQKLRDRKVPVAVVTSKAREMAWRGMELCGIAEHFEILIGSDDVERHKPDPMPVLVGCERLSIEPSACAYVGDSVHDMAAARAAGTQAVAAGWGPFEHGALRKAGATSLLMDPLEIGSLA